MKRHNSFCTIYQNHSFSGLPKLPPGASLCKRLRRYIRKLTLISDTNPMTKYFLRSSAKILNEKRSHIRSKHWFVFHPFSLIILYWTYFYGFILTFDLSLRPYLCYDSKFLHDIYNQKNDLLFAIMILLNFIEIMNLAIRLNTGYYVYETKQLVLEPHKIFKAYGLTSFIFDLLIAQPIISIYFYVEKLNDEESLVLIHTILLLPLLRKKRIEIAKQFFDRFVEIIIKQPTLNLIVKYVVYVMLILHWFTCAEIALVYLDMNYIKGAHYQEAHEVYLEHIKNHHYLKCLLNTIESCFHLQSDPVAYAGIYKSEICKMIFGIFFKGYLAAVMINHFLIYYGPKRKNNDIMCQLKEFVKRNQLNSHLQNRLKTFLSNNFRHQYFDEASILTSLSDHLRMEMKINSCNPEIEINLFSGISKSEIGKIIKCFRSEIYLPHDIIIKAGSQDDKTYFINNGSVYLISLINKNEICHLTTGDMFGALCLHPFETFPYSVIADTYVEVYVLSQKNFNDYILKSDFLRSRFQFSVNYFLEAYKIESLPVSQ